MSESPDTICTPRLRLRRMVASDAPRLVVLWNDPEITRYLPPMRVPVDEERARTAIWQYDQHWARHGYGIWAIEELASGEFVGYGGLRYVAEESAAESITVLARSAWGKGFATEAAGAAERFGFEQAGLERIIGVVDAGNVAARRAAERLGKRLEREFMVAGKAYVLYGLARPAADGGE